VTRELLFAGNRLQFRIESGSDGATLAINGTIYEFAVKELAPGRLVMTNSDGRRAARVVRDRDRIWVWLEGKTFVFQIPSADHSGEGGHTKIDDDLRAPMPGTLVKLLVAPGDAVEEDQVVAVVEAMKMEHPLRAPRAGVVDKVSGAVGTIVDADAIIVSLKRVE
jgi:biotin carboxyl carrier protein